MTAPSDPNAKVLVWQIVRPEVRQPESRYDGNPRVPANGALQGLDIGAVPDIHFQPGDRITVDAGGCVRRGLEHRIG